MVISTGFLQFEDGRVEAVDAAGGQSRGGFIRYSGFLDIFTQLGLDDGEAPVIDPGAVRVPRMHDLRHLKTRLRTRRQELPPPFQPDHEPAHAPQRLPGVQPYRVFGDFSAPLAPLKYKAGG